MPITQHEYDYFQPHLQWLQAAIGTIPRTLAGGVTYGVNIADIAVGVVPKSVPMGTAAQANTAVYVPFTTKSPQIKMMNTALTEYLEEHPTEVVPAAVDPGKIFVTVTKALTTAEEFAARPAGQRIQDFVILWHELGHGVLERLKRDLNEAVANNEDNAYVVELDVLLYALNTGYLTGAGLRGELVGYLANRVDQFKLGAKTRVEIRAGVLAIKAELITQGADLTETNTAFTPILDKLP